MNYTAWSDLLLHFLAFSPLALGGAMAAAPGMHRYLVDQTALLTNQQFISSIAIAQGSPGPNLMFVAIFGWHAGGVLAGTWLGRIGGLAGTTAAMLIPSSILALLAARWIEGRRGNASMRAITAGLAPISLALIFSTSWILTAVHDRPDQDWPLWMLTLAATLLVWRTRTPILLILALGAMSGAIGLV